MVTSKNSRETPRVQIVCNIGSSHHVHEYGSMLRCNISLYINMSTTPPERTTRDKFKIVCANTLVTPNWWWNIYYSHGTRTLRVKRKNPINFIRKAPFRRTELDALSIARASYVTARARAPAVPTRTNDCFLITLME